MPQLDFNTFAGVAWWLTIIFYISYAWFLLYAFPRVLAGKSAAKKYRLWYILTLVQSVEELKDEDKKLS